LWIINQLKDANRTGTPWKDMAILYRSYYPVGQTIEKRLKAAGIPVSSKKEVKFTDDQDTIKLISVHSSKGLEFPVVAIPGVGSMNEDKFSTEAEVRLLYVAMTRATSRLIMTSHKDSPFTQKLQAAMS
jgi:superfamily I DNA/RNA helicase